MNIKNIIVHNLIKDSDEQAPECKFREDELNKNDKHIITMCEELLALYSRKSTLGIGSFEPDTKEFYFSLDLKKFHENKTNMVTFSVDAMKRLESRVKSKIKARGGYVLFVYYTLNESTYLLAAMIRDKEGSTIDKKLNIIKNMHLDLDKLHVCCQVNITKWLNKEDTYLTFIKGIQSTTPQYFLEFIGCNEFTDSKTQTQTLYTAFNAHCSERKYSSDTVERLKENIFNYCKEQHKLGRPIRLETISRIMNEDKPEEFVEFINKKSYKVSSSFAVHAISLRRFKRYSGHNKKITISFDSELWDKQVKIIQKGVSVKLKEDTLLITEIPENLLKDIEDGTTHR
ncbi:nucleoid-associated protein [Desulfovibrio sp. UCD-KL4C]|uniref:nucleoid-associated protein n=1 Tax=Desulfovibrio sp. UCD-KL4C TaxID=2578120 RepID=UPI0025BBBEC6|nr:nucleoid-associated protein [Desulfovibrio sp. UCD-KL4C]